jgi:two-component system, OmpR family, sensor histidine kinase KdpD
MTDEKVKPEEERLLVCLGPGTSFVQLMNSVKPVAAGLKAKWLAVFVDTPKMLLLSEERRNRILDSLHWAEQLGAETFTMTGRNVAEEIIKFAEQRNITKVIVGKSKGSRWKKFLLRSPLDKLVRIDSGIDVYVISGNSGKQREILSPNRPQKIRLSDYGGGLLLFILANVLCFLMYPTFHLSNLIMIYLLGVMITATGCGRGPAVLNSFLSVLAFDFFFVPPRFSFTVEEAQFIVTFIVMFLVAVVISHLADRLRQQTLVARHQERQANAMHGLSRQLASIRGSLEIFRVAVKYLSEIFDCPVMALQFNVLNKLKVIVGDPSSIFHQDILKEIQIARQAYGSGKIAGLGIQTTPSSEILYVPLRAADNTFGVLALRPPDPERLRLPEQLNLLESLGKQIALSLEVEHLVEKKNLNG